MKELILNIIAKLREDYYNSSLKMKIVLLSSASVAFIVLVVILMLKCSSSPNKVVQHQCKGRSKTAAGGGAE